MPLCFLPQSTTFRNISVIEKITQEGKVEYPTGSSYGSKNDFFEADHKFKSEFKDAFLLEGSIKEQCSYFRQRSKGELDKFEAELNRDSMACQSLGTKTSIQANSIGVGGSNVSAIASLTASIDDLVLNKGKAILKSSKCITCHDLSSGHNVGPPIHFTDAKRFAEDDDSYARLGNDLASETAYLMSDKTPLEQRMPLNNPALTADEQKAVVEYLKFLSRSGRSQEDKIPTVNPSEGFVR